MGGGVCLFQVNIEELVALITDRKGRLCFQKRLSVILSMCVCVGGRLVCINRGSLVRGGGGLHRGQSVSRGSSYGGGSAYRGGLHPGGLPNSPPQLTSGGPHCSGRYASYWNAFLFAIKISE